MCPVRSMPHTGGFHPTIQLVSLSGGGESTLERDPQQGRAPGSVVSVSAETHGMLAEAGSRTFPTVPPSQTAQTVQTADIGLGGGGSREPATWCGGNLNPVTAGKQ